MIKDKLIPELRFPEFKNEGEWDEKTLIDVCDITNGKANVQDHVENGNYPLFDRSELIKASNEFIFDSEAVIIPGEGMRFIPKYYEGKFNLHQRAYALKDFKCSGQFVYYSMFHRSALISQKAVQSTVLSLRLPILQKFPLEIPENPKEQQHIASCLSSLDEVIAANSQKLELLKKHKKGLMQNLFPQEGETVPKYRFKEFENDGEWVEKKLEGLAKRGSGHTPNKQVPNYYNGGIKWVSLADSNKLDNGYIYATKIQISKDGIENSSAVLHPLGTVILSRDAGVGKSAVLYSDMAVSQHFIVWVCDEVKLSNWFLYYVFQILKPVFESIAVGSTIKTIGLPYFKELLISVPSIQEQKKIASCLSSLDALITAQAEKIEQLKLHKKGLMQGLFPKIND